VGSTLGACVVVPVATFWRSLTDVHGVEVHASWARIFARLAATSLFLGDRHPGWSAARFSGRYRSKASVLGLCAVVLDYDEGGGLDDACRAWAGAYGFVHTTKSHTPHTPSFRVVLPLSREVSRAEYARCYPVVARRAGVTLCNSGADAARFWYLPGAVEPIYSEARWLRGAPLEVADLLAESARFERVAANESSRKTSRPRAAPADDAVQHARNRLALLRPAISGQRGHDALFGAAAAIVALGLDEDAAVALLEQEFNPRCQPPWSRKDIVHKVHDALRRQ